VEEEEWEREEQVEKVIWGKIQKFLQRRNLKRGVLSRLLKVNFIFWFLFLFYFYFYFSIFNF